MENTTIQKLSNKWLNVPIIATITRLLCRKLTLQEGRLMDGMNKFTLLRAAVLIIPQGILETQEFKKRFWAEMAARIHQLIRGMWGRFCDTLVLDNTSNGSVLPVVQVGARAKVRAKLAPLTLVWCSLVFRSSS